VKEHLDKVPPSVEVVESFDGAERDCALPPPVGRAGSRIAPPDADIISYRQKYLSYARSVSYAMPARAVYWSVVVAARKLFDPDTPPEHEESPLGGRFLRMYLDQQLDPELLSDAGSAIAESQHFAILRMDIQAALQSAGAGRAEAPSTDEVRAAADKLVKSQIARGLEWRKDGLYPVIGGAGGLSVDAAQRTGVQEDGKRLLYELRVAVNDTYDFSSKRTGNYARTREELARLLASNRFNEFECKLRTLGFTENSFIQTSGYTSLFAAFMYALEKRGWTGIAWKVSLPMTVGFDRHASQSMIRIVLLASFWMTAACGDDGRTTTQQAKALIGEEFPFLFAIPGFAAERHWHHGEEFQSLVLEGELVFARRGNAEPESLASLRKRLLAAARKANFKPAGEPLSLTRPPPKSERAWIDSAEPSAQLELQKEQKFENGARSLSRCRIWIDPNATRFAASYDLAAF
jgi:hypothetical protein